MKIKFLLPALLAVALTASAEGFKDGIEYYKAGQFENAKTILESNLNNPSTDKALAYYYLGQIAIIDKDVKTAKSDFEKGIAADANNPYNFVGLGLIDLLSGNESAAAANFKEAQKLGKKNHEITVDIARAYYTADPVKFAKKVEEYLAKAHKESKHTEPAIYILEGDMLFDAKDLGGAAGKYEMATTYDEGNPEGYVKYANAYMGVNPTYSVAKLEELLAKKPGSALAQRELAEKYYETNQWTKAARQYGKYIENPNHFPEDRARYAVLLYANSEYAKSLEIAKSLLATKPNDFQTRRVEFLDLAELKMYPEAAQAAEAFLALTPSGKEKFNPNDYITYGAVLENLDQDSLAIMQYEAAIACDPSKVDNYKILSDAYMKAQDYQKAAEAFEKYILNNPAVSLTDYLQASGKWLNAASHATDEVARYADAEKGLEAINQVISQATSINPVFYQRQGRLYYARANKADQNVRDSYLKVIEILDQDPANADPANPSNKLGLYKEACLFIGNFYQENGDKDLQSEYYQKADAYDKMLKGE